jgi:hypothetical protein
VDFVPVEIAKEFPSLTQLTIQSSNIPVLKNGMFPSEFKNLKILYVSSSPSLTSIEADVFRELTNLEQIYLNDNSIDSIKYEIFKTNLKLNTIYFCRNKIKMVYPTVFNNLRLLHTVHFEGNECGKNTFSCTDCSQPGSPLHVALQSCYSGCKSDPGCAVLPTTTQKPTTTTTLEPTTETPVITKDQSGNINISLKELGHAKCSTPNFIKIGTSSMDNKLIDLFIDVDRVKTCCAKVDQLQIDKMALEKLGVSLKQVQDSSNNNIEKLERRVEENTKNFQVNLDEMKLNSSTEVSNLKESISILETVQEDFDSILVTLNSTFENQVDEIKTSIQDMETTVTNKLLDFHANLTDGIEASKKDCLQETADLNTKVKQNHKNLLVTIEASENRTTKSFEVMEKQLSDIASEIINDMGSMNETLMENIAVLSHSTDEAFKTLKNQFEVDLESLGSETSALQNNMWQFKDDFKVANEDTTRTFSTLQYELHRCNLKTEENNASLKAFISFYDSERQIINAQDENFRTEFQEKIDNLNREVNENINNKRYARWYDTPAEDDAEIKRILDDVAFVKGNMERVREEAKNRIERSIEELQKAIAKIDTSNMDLIQDKIDQIVNPKFEKIDLTFAMISNVHIQLTAQNEDLKAEVENLKQKINVLENKTPGSSKIRDRRNKISARGS